MATLSDAEKAELDALSDDEKALLAQFEEPEHVDDGGESQGDEPPAGDATGDGGETPPEPEAQGAGGEGAGEESQGGEQQSDTLKIGDREVPRSEVEALLDFQQWANQNPDKMKAFGQYLSGEAEFVARQQQEQQQQQQEKDKVGEIDWDMVDPAVKAAYEQQQKSIEELNQRFEQTQGPIQAWQQEQMQNVAREAEDQISKATDQIKEKFSLDLTPEEIDELHQTTAKLNILPGLRQSIANPTEAVATALELAIFKTPKFRDKIVGAQVASERAQDKRHLAGTVGGSTGSDRSGLQSGAGEVDVKKMSPEDRKKAMAAEIAESMRGTP